jgi:hypothetical protein
MDQEARAGLRRELEADLLPAYEIVETAGASQRARPGRLERRDRGHIQLVKLLSRANPTLRLARTASIGQRRTGKEYLCAFS